MDTSASIWQGERVRLRAIEPSDWEAYFAWNQDDEQARSVSNIPFPQSAEAVRQWAQQEATRKPERDAFRFVIKNETGEVVGDLTTHNCDARVGSFSYGITIRREHRRNGYAAEAITLVLRYYFRELRYQKATVTVFSFNEVSARLHEKLGFQLEGRIRRTQFTNGALHDELIYGITAEEFAAGDGKTRVIG
ncbi:MAG: N-acetyltransferase [Thermomicrobiales bacterium]|jgi:RimJ/RimL family protein N-acetyltransferase|nr:N-acetyltransferase [Thermomicrobiales bacterium]MDF3017795.1 N-acetyltransferase [Thermomicrobiales bacterium]